jgi:hypothetical protein
MLVIHTARTAYSLGRLVEKKQRVKWVKLPAARNHMLRSVRDIATIDGELRLVSAPGT